MLEWGGRAVVECVASLLRLQYLGIVNEGCLRSLKKITAVSRFR